MHIDSTAEFQRTSSYGRHLFTNGLSLDYAGNGFSIHSTTGFQYLKDDMKMDQDYTSKSVFHPSAAETALLEPGDHGEMGTQRNYRWVVGAFSLSITEITPVAIKEEGMLLCRDTSMQPWKEWVLR